MCSIGCTISIEKDVLSTVHMPNYEQCWWIAIMLDDANEVAPTRRFKNTEEINYLDSLWNKSMKIVFNGVIHWGKYKGDPIEVI